jgi:uncharacterized protein (TIGR02996 family)
MRKPAFVAHYAKLVADRGVGDRMGEAHRRLTGVALTDHDALVAAIRDCHDDDTPRLVYADWLDDQGGDLARHAAFVRAQIATARAGGGVEARRWSGKATRLPQMFGPMVYAEEEQTPATLVLRNAGGTGVVWHRGCLEAVSCGPNDWLRVGHEVLKRHPIRWVHLRPRYGDFSVLHDGQGRFLPTGTDVYVAERLKWVVAARQKDLYAAITGDWVALAHGEIRLFFEAVFPTVSFVVGPGSPVLGYPAVERPERIAVKAYVTPPKGVPWP